MKRPGHKTPLNPRWYIRNMDLLHWRTTDRYRIMRGARGTTVQHQAIRDRSKQPLIHKGKKP